MKILIACSCLEPAMDGVGDYTRRLAAEIRARGHDCHILALADPYATGPTPCEFREGVQVVSGLRLPATLPWRERTRLAREFCERVAPDWISWQIVPYGFHPRGLSFGLGRRLREISRGCKTHVMFHEIWIGLAEQSLLKHKLTGKVQREIIRELLRQLRPQVVHTHTPLYRHLLSGLGQRVSLLPLFGNIPIATSVDPDWLEKKWPESGAKFRADRANGWIFAMFGSIHPEWDAEDFRQRAVAASEKAGKKCLVISIGKAGGAGEQKLRHLRENSGEAWQVLALGRQPDREISQCLLAADFGVSSVPPENVFKSGTVAAMHEHGLQVIVTRPLARYSNCPPGLLTIGMRGVVTDFNLDGVKKSKADNFLPAIAAQFIADLQKA